MSVHYLFNNLLWSLWMEEKILKNGLSYSSNQSINRLPTNTNTNTQTNKQQQNHFFDSNPENVWIYTRSKELKYIQWKHLKRLMFSNVTGELVIWKWENVFKLFHKRKTIQIYQIDLISNISNKKYKIKLSSKKGKNATSSIKIHNFFPMSRNEKSRSKKINNQNFITYKSDQCGLNRIRSEIESDLLINHQQP